MIPRINRLIKNKDFQNIFKNGRLINRDFIWIKYKKNNLKLVRIGFLVGLKISKKATERNKIKRKLRAIFSRFLKELSGYDIIVGVKPKIKEKKFSEIFEAIKEIISEII